MRAMRHVVAYMVIRFEVLSCHFFLRARKFVCVIPAVIPLGTYCSLGVRSAKLFGMFSKQTRTRFSHGELASRLSAGMIEQSR